MIQSNKNKEKPKLFSNEEIRNRICVDLLNSKPL